MATHSSILAWRIPWTEELGRLLCAVHRIAQNQTWLKRLSMPGELEFIESTKFIQPILILRPTSTEIRVWIPTCVYLSEAYLSFLNLSFFLCPWDSPGKNTGVGCHVLQDFLQEIFPRIKTAPLTSPALSGRFFTPSATWDLSLKNGNS